MSRLRRPPPLSSIAIAPVEPLHEKYNLKRHTALKRSDGQEFQFDFEDIKDMKFIGEGAFGVVSKFYHEKSNLWFAIKRVDGKRLDESNRIEGNKREIMDIFVPIQVGEFAYLVKFYGALYAEGDYWILSELMDSSLDFFINKTGEKNIQIPELFFSKLAHAVTQALIYLKSKGCMHRDIKPSNILINRDGQIKVCDFGISGKINQSICMTVGKGCRPYMSPEKIDEKLGQNGYTVKSDIWSLGITLVEMANSKHPYVHLDYVQQLITIVKNDAPRLDSTKYSKQFCDFVDVCLKKVEIERASPNELIEHEFIKQHEKDNNDTVLINQVIDLINIEPNDNQFE